MAKARTVDKLFALQDALQCRELSRSDVLVLAVLIEYASRRDGVAWPSLETLADVTGLGRRTVQMAVQRLEAEHFIEVIERGGGRTRSTRYRVLLDRERPPLEEAIKLAAQKRAHDPAPFPEQKGCRPVQKGCRTVRERVQSSAPEPSYEPSELNPSVATAPPNGVAPAMKGERHPHQEVAQRLREIQDVLREAQDRPLTKGERKWLRHHQEWCAEVEDAYAHDDDPKTADLGFQAQRLLGDIDWRLEGA